MRRLPKSGLRRGIVECLISNPVPALSLVLYMSLRSSAIMPADDWSEGWAPAYRGWYDILLVASVCAGIAAGTVRVTRGTLVVLFVLLAAVLASLLSGSMLGPDFVASGLIYYARFAVAFAFGAWVVQGRGVEAAESFVFLLFLVLAGTAVFVYSLNLGSFNRIYASAMTVASFGQIAAVTCFLALMRRHRTMMILTAVFLLLTFSRTSIIVLLLLGSIYLFHCRDASLFEKTARIAGLLVLLVIGGALLVRYGDPEFQGVLTRAIDWQEVSTLNGRLEIWSYAIQLAGDLRVPLTGVGFNAASSLLSTNEFSFTVDGGETVQAAHFHSIIFEYGFGFGIFSILIFVGLARRVAETFTNRVYPAFFIFSYFALTQSIDFTFYRPKEVIVWSLLLGIADCQWRMNRQAIRTSLAGAVRATDRATYHHLSHRSAARSPSL